MPHEGSEFFDRLADAIERAVAFSPGQQAARAMLAGPQRYSCLVGGSRAGKTFLAVHAIVESALAASGSRHGLFRFRANAARASLALDTLPKVVAKCFPGVRLTEHRQDGFFGLPNGAELWVSGLDDKERVEKILGLEFATIFLNEASQIPYGSALTALTRLAQMVPGLRQRAIVDLNPVARSHWTNILFGEKRDPVSRRPLDDPDNYQRAFLNPVDNASNLSPEYLASLAALPERQRRRFYEGVYVDEADDQLWTFDILDRCRCDPARIPEGERAAVVVAVDPSGASGRNDLAADEIGIVVAARGLDGHAYILADLSARLSPREWAARAVHAFHEYAADCIVAESNFGGEMVRSTIEAADRNVPVRLVTASRGKAVRAEPISVRYHRGEVHHVDRFDKLEDQLLGFTTGGFEGSGSPDHADASIWALTHLLGGESNAGIIEYYERQAREQAGLGAQDGYHFGASNGSLSVRCFAPSPTTVVLITGRTVSIGEDLVLDCTPREAKPLRAIGFTVPPIEEAENG